ncbi:MULTISPECIES: hypothetical protein [Streptomyces]|uniref:Uncharacterized protein n=3 Tax=Streptomyces TaxID=1883 RepID=A0A3S9PG48_STRLT|nr:hypothetical protein [Streptomyces luteoverticillatus]AZQ71294.1 hypothetical protein EKH77_08770 [Streptomyces luteoverticillatus]
MRLLAYMLRHGDLMDHGRDRREVSEIRRRGHDVIVVFKEGEPVRVGREDSVTVRRGWSYGDGR